MSKRSKVIELKEVVIRFSGDSGDGMQLTGSLFSDVSAFLGNDLSTFPDYPAEIRAPQGTVSGVSGFQVHLGNSEVYTPGDIADVLVAMNPAALKANNGKVREGGTIVMDVDSFDEKNLTKAGYLTDDPITEDQLQDYNIIKAPITTLTRNSLEDFGLDNKSILRSKNMYALGLVNWLFHQPIEAALEAIDKKFSKKNPNIAKANKKVLRDGYNYGVTIQALTPSYHINAAELKPGRYRTINGNLAISWGLIAASQKSGRELFLGTYPITPASEILQELSGRKDLGVKVFQAEDEIAGICTAIGASFAGDLAATSTSGPGLALMSEAIGLAVITELPLVIINVQRGGPSTGLPTKTEQSDLMQALYGRNGESPAVVMATSSPSDCFKYTYWAAKIAMEHMTPVILLSDGYLANGSQPWRIPKLKDFPNIIPPIPVGENEDWQPYARNEKLVREWAYPSMHGYQHRIGGLEKEEDTGNVSYDGVNHEKMTKTRQAKIDEIAHHIPDLILYGPPEADLLVLGWGGTFGHLYTAIDDMNIAGNKVAFAHFRFIHPFPKNTAEILGQFKKIVVCELNNGQLASYLRMNFPEKRFRQYNKIQGLPFTVDELKSHFTQLKNESDE